MLILHANEDLKVTFETLIKTIGARVEWNHNFIVTGDLLILEGTVRSLYFQFDNRQVVTNLVELDYKPEDIIEISEHPKLANFINIILYVFGKWGTLSGVKVEKDYDQLNLLFRTIFREYYIEPMYRMDNFRFYKDKIRITYEDVFELALEAEEHPLEEPEELLEEEEESSGLWHNLVWLKEQYSFQRIRTTLRERISKRIGHNFYMVGYRCPNCNTNNLHMGVYPVGHELRIETEEKGVYIARSYTCDSCNCFYTPRPGRLLVEGDIYEMAFGADRKAYEDYLDLLGKDAQRTSNYKFNEYESMRNRKDVQSDALDSAEEAAAQMEEYCEDLENLPEIEFNRFTDRIEDSFYPDSLVWKHEPKIQEQILHRRNKKKKEELEADKQQEHEEEIPQEALSKKTRGHVPESLQGHATESLQGHAPESLQGHVPEKLQERAMEKSEGNEAAKKTDYSQRTETHSGETARRKSRLPSKTELRGFDDEKSMRTSKWEYDEEEPRRRTRREHDEEETDSFEKTKLNEARVKKTIDTYEKKTRDCETKSYSHISKVIKDLEEEPIERKYKEPFLKRLFHFRKKKGTEEVKRIMEKMPKHLDHASYKKLEQKLSEYEDVDMSPYEEDLRQKRNEAEQQAIADLFQKARKNNREDYVGLMRQLEEQQFAEENVEPYMDRLKEKIREEDVRALKKICDEAAEADYENALDIYEQIQEGSYLPELKENALDILSNRLAKLKSDECDLLVQKLKDDLKGKIRENPRFHFYPAKKVLMKQAAPEETEVIDHALASYAGGRNPFEYPILVVDTSRNQSGKEGMVLTPEHLFYSTKLSAYRIAIPDIDTITASTGLLNRKIALEETNTAKHKLPYAVGNDEMKAWAEELENYIHYLQEKPHSRDVAYLARETHDTICCYRCGYVYHGTDVCPKCGYKKNH